MTRQRNYWRVIGPRVMKSGHNDTFPELGDLVKEGKGWVGSVVTV